MSPRHLVIGLGQRYRGDDAAGLLAAMALEARRVEGVDTLLMDGDAAGLLDAWTGRQRVILIDALATAGRPCGAVMVLDVSHKPLPASEVAVSSHAMGLRDAVELGRALGRLPKEVIVIGIVGARFGMGAGVSPEVQETIDRIVADWPALPASHGGGEEGCMKPMS